MSSISDRSLQRGGEGGIILQDQGAGHAAQPGLGLTNPGVARGFNPQPEPPGDIYSFNPQPEPPGRF